MKGGKGRRISHCKRGHPMIPSNLNLYFKGPLRCETVFRHCRTCNRERALAHYYRRKRNKIYSEAMFI